jgi:predicted RNA-binding Zn-ribbon protein involved in translation (DUF1610 family)
MHGNAPDLKTSPRASPYDARAKIPRATQDDYAHPNCSRTATLRCQRLRLQGEGSGSRSPELLSFTRPTRINPVAEQLVERLCTQNVGTSSCGPRQKIPDQKGLQVIAAHNRV